MMFATVPEPANEKSQDEPSIRRTGYHTIISENFDLLSSSVESRGDLVLKAHRNEGTLLRYTVRSRANNPLHAMS